MFSFGKLAFYIPRHHRIKYLASSYHHYLMYYYRAYQCSNHPKWNRSNLFLDYHRIRQYQFYAQVYRAIALALKDHSY